MIADFAGGVADLFRRLNEAGHDLLDALRVGF